MPGAGPSAADPVLGMTDVMTLAVTVTATAAAQASERRAGLDRLYGHLYPGDMDRHADRLDSAAYAA